MEDNYNIIETEFDYGEPDCQGDETTQWAVNEAAIYFNDDELVIAYGDGKIIGITIDNEQERAVVRTVLSDANFWTAFLGGLSGAMQQIKEQDIGG